MTEAVSVPLYGLRGKGRAMVLDAAVWEIGRANGWPSEFTVMFQPNGAREYVVTTRRPISTNRRPVPLARLIADAQPGDVVLFGDGDSLNLRACNLVKLTRSTANKFVGEKRSLKKLQRAA